MTPHPSASQMRDRLSKRKGWIDPRGCAVYADKVEKRLTERLLKEQGEKHNE